MVDVHRPNRCLGIWTKADDGVAGQPDRDKAHLVFSELVQGEHLQSEVVHFSMVESNPPAAIIRNGGSKSRTSWWMFIPLISA